MTVFSDGEVVRIVTPFRGVNGTLYEAGWTGTIFPFDTTLKQSQESDRYEINLHDSPSGEGRGIVILQSIRFERASPERQEGELRQGDRIRLTTSVNGQEAGALGTVVGTIAKVDQPMYLIAVDFGEVVTISGDQFEHLEGLSAKVTFSDEGAVRVDYSDNKAF